MHGRALELLLELRLPCCILINAGQLASSLTISLLMFLLPNFFLSFHSCWVSASFLSWTLYVRPLFLLLLHYNIFWLTRADLSLFVLCTAKTSWAHRYIENNIANSTKYLYIKRLEIYLVPDSPPVPA
jgi:hypothetical protein